MADVEFLTSGSTGEPKRVLRTEASLAADAASLVAAFPEVWRGKPAVVSTARPEHMLGHLWRVRAPAAAGCASDPATIVSVEELSEAARRHGRIVFVTTPSFLEKAAVHPDFPSLRGSVQVVVVSGGALRAETALAVLASIGTCPLEIYGSTEAGTVAWRRQSEGDLCTLHVGVEASCGDRGALVVDSPYAATRPIEMSDAAEFVAPRRFRLLGRLDRRVKILESFVSLPAVESALEAHHLVAAARVEALGGDVPRLGALVVPSDAGARALAAGTHAALAGTLRRDVMPIVGERSFPRRVRFVRELPVDARGKTTAADARAALAAWCREPAVLSWSAVADRLEARIVFPPDCECFDGHFPGMPILPGVAQLYFLRHFSRQAFADFPDAATYRRLKFQRIVTPGREVVLSVVRRAPGTFGFTMSVEGGPASSGTVEGGLA